MDKRQIKDKIVRQIDRYKKDRQLALKMIKSLLNKSTMRALTELTKH